MAAEEAMLATFARWLQPHTVFCSYNGRSYDAPLLKTRYRLARQAADVDLQRIAVGEDLSPGLAHGREADDARAARMDAHDLVLLGPDGHQRVDIALGQRLVEGGLGFQRGGEVGFAHGVARWGFGMSQGRVCGRRQMRRGPKPPCTRDCGNAAGFSDVPSDARR